MIKILIVEDNPDNLLLLRSILEPAGMEVVEAHDGLAAVAAARSHDPDVIVMDIQLPEIDGLEATRRIRKLPGKSKIPIIAMTSYAMPGDRNLFFKGGCSGYIQKPINVDTVVSEILGFLE